MEEPLKEPAVIGAPLGTVLILLFSLWAGWGALIFWATPELWIVERLIGVLAGSFVLALSSLAIFLSGYTKWHRPMTPEERARWKEENTKKAAAIHAARENQERHLRQIREGVEQLITEMESNPIVGRMLHDARRRASKEAGEQLLANADIALAGLGAWLIEQGIPNRLPGDLFAGFAKGKIEEHFSSLSPKERTALQRYLPRVARLLEEALEVMSPREVVKEILLPLFFGEM